MTRDDEIEQWLADYRRALPQPDPKYAKALNERSDAEMNEAIDVAEAMLNDFPNDTTPVFVATVARLIFGDKGFTEWDLTKACQDPGVRFAAQAVVDLAGFGLRL